MPVTAVEFDYVRVLVYGRAAIVLDDGKEYLVESRLQPLARRVAEGSLTKLVQRLRTEPYGALHNEVVEAMTTNETSFFRDRYPFDAMAQHVLPQLSAARSGAPLTVWSAACSSGQEAYSLGMLIHERFPSLASGGVRFHASDISTGMLARAAEGRYSHLEVNRGLPAPLLVKYFERRGVDWEIKEQVRRMVEFRQMNLAGPWPTLPSMDVVFMRNVLIYFDTETKRAVLDRLRRILRPDGYLFLGAAETTLNLDDSYERVLFDKATCYRLRNGGA
jgi:chemotaxis protein methyltransferase CheR